jgi:hypothetical protein
LHGYSSHRPLDGKSVVAGGDIRGARRSVTCRIFCGARCAQRGGGKEKGSSDRNPVEIALRFQCHRFDVLVSNGSPAKVVFLRPGAACAQLFTMSSIRRNSQDGFAEFRRIIA